MKCLLTAFTSIFDNKTDKRLEFESFEKLENLLYKLSEQPGYKVRKDEKIPDGVTPSPLISPAEYKSDSTRSAKNVVKWCGWACIDVDEYTLPFHKQIKTFSAYQYVCYSTASSSKIKPKFRVVFPLTRDVLADDIPHFWFALNKEFSSVVDEQTKDMSRMFYVPAKYPNAFNFIFSNSGEVIDPSVLMGKHSYVRKPKTAFDSLSEDAQRQILEHRRQKFTNTSYKWTSHRDCPFVTKNMLNAYMTVSSSWYHESYKLMCKIARRALSLNYPITAHDVASIFRSIDVANGNWYQNRPIEAEAERALQYALRSTI